MLWSLRLLLLERHWLLKTTWLGAQAVVAVANTCRIVDDQLTLDDSNGNLFVALTCPFGQLREADRGERKNT